MSCEYKLATISVCSPVVSSPWGGGRGVSGRSAFVLFRVCSGACLSRVRVGCVSPCLVPLSLVVLSVALSGRVWSVVVPGGAPAPGVICGSSCCVFGVLPHDAVLPGSDPEEGRTPETLVYNPMSSSYIA